jgi:RNA polymerase sigma factor (sigma-70 family)
VRAGDERAFEAIFDRHHRPLLAFCRHMLGTREDAEDALQHVFVAAHAALLADDRPIQLKPWLYAIARNRCLSVLRSRRDAVALDADFEPSTDGLAVAHEVERRQELRDMLADLGRLAPEQREALVLAELGDLSHEEIAAVLGVVTGKVKALIFQARENLAGYRQARAADCEEIRAQLATLRGSALRRAHIQRHVAVCSGCAAFRDEVSRQRAALAVLLPVVPSVALKHSALSAAGVAAAGESGAVLSGLAAAGSSGGVAKTLAVVAVVAGTGGGAVAVRQAATSPAGAAIERAARATVPAHAATARPLVVRATATPVARATPRARTTGPARPASRRAKHARGAAAGTRGRSATAPGRTGTAGKSAIAPGRTGTAGRSAAAPGRTGTAGRSAAAPGRTGTAGKSATAPGRLPKPAIPEAAGRSGLAPGRATVPAPAVAPPDRTKIR